MSIKSNLLKFGLGIIGLNTFTACYGPAMPPPDVTTFKFGGKVVNEEGIPLHGIKISRYGGVYAASNFDGLFEFPIHLMEGEVKDTLHFTFRDPDKIRSVYRDQVVVADFSSSPDDIDNVVVMEENK